jgi:hypothetical protein
MELWVAQNQVLPSTKFGHGSGLNVQNLIALFLLVRNIGFGAGGHTLCAFFGIAHVLGSKIKFQLP